ncbi:MAG: sigma-70 family RNA polymerase sigma factor [Bacteroidaceae bacterium]|nr:sigma-70 family RNA polymerase sigma factor [Bacteroidaceae bacterium]
MTSDTFKEKAQTMRPMLMATARRILGDDAEAEDVVQDALLRLWQLRDEPILNVEGMARVVVQHLSIDALRRRRENIPIEEIEVVGTSYSEGLSDTEMRMMTLIRQLPTLQQTILRLRHVEEMEVFEIAEMIGATEAAVRQSLSRARRKLLEQFTQKGLKR